MDLINTGVSASERMRRDTFVSSIRDIALEKMQIGGSSMRLSEVLIHYSFIFSKFVICQKQANHFTIRETVSKYNGNVVAVT